MKLIVTIKKGNESEKKLMEARIEYSKKQWEEKEKIIEMWEEIGLKPDEVKQLMLKHEKLIAAKEKENIEEESSSMSSRILNKKIDILQTENVRLTNEISILMNQLTEARNKNIKMLQKIQFMRDTLYKLTTKHNDLKSSKELDSKSRTINIYRRLLKKVYKIRYIEEKVCEGCEHENEGVFCCGCEDGCNYKELIKEETI